MSSTNDENMEAIEILVNSRHDYLSDWEAEFLDDISVRLEAGKGLTDKQQAKLNDIWKRVMTR